MSQIKINDRNRIEFLVALGWPLPRIAADLGRSPSTIRNEMLEHRLDSGKGFRCSNRNTALLLPHNYIILSRRE
jgi:IS30 family transposase